MFTAVVIFLSKYFSSAKENKKSENIDIRIEGMSVNKAKNVMYFLFDLYPSTSISVLIDFLIFIKKMIKKNNNKNIFEINKYCRFVLLSL